MSIREAIEHLPRRIEYISGQQFSYVKLDDVLALLAFTPAEPPQPRPCEQCANTYDGHCNSGACPCCPAEPLERR